MNRWILLIVVLGSLISCANSNSSRLAPVTEGWHTSNAGRNAYIVQQGDTLYSIAWSFDTDYRDLAEINHLAQPYLLRSGQRLYLAKPVFQKSQPKVAPIAISKKIKTWLWPARGKVVARFNSAMRGGNRGIDIAGVYGEPVIASAAGKVVYSGTGIHSYGKLLIIKHNDDYLSAYAYNKTMMVHEGQMVIAGQKIATMGRNDEGKACLHFEIRRGGKAVNPLLYAR